MTVQRSLLDISEGRKARDEGIERAGCAADDDWKEEAKDTVVKLANSLPHFIADHMWAAGLPKPKEPRALGSIMMWAQRQGLIHSTGTTKQTSQASGHCHPVTVWESLVYKG